MNSKYCCMCKHNDSKKAELMLKLPYWPLSNIEILSKIFNVSLSEAQEKLDMVKTIIETAKCCKLEEMTSFKLNEEIKKLKSKNEKLKADVEYLTEICHKEGYRV